MLQALSVTVSKVVPVLAEKQSGIAFTALPSSVTSSVKSLATLTPDVRVELCRTPLFAPTFVIEMFPLTHTHSAPSSCMTVLRYWELLRQCHPLTLTMQSPSAWLTPSFTHCNCSTTITN
jgi:hypothetical protein